jgi:hypothetical protein
VWDGKRWTRDAQKSIKALGKELAKIFTQTEHNQLLNSIDARDRLPIQTLQARDLAPEQRGVKVRPEEL